MIFSQLKVIAIAGALVALVGAFWYVSGLRADLMQEKLNNQILEDSIASQQLDIKQMQEDFKDIRAVNAALAEEANRQKEEVRNLADRLNTTATGRSRDFGLLASERPRAIKRLVNRGTKNAMRCLELASGAQLTKEELDATLSSQINPECPSLANPNYQGNPQ